MLWIAMTLYSVSTPVTDCCSGNICIQPVGGRPQIVGYDAESLGGWDVETGKRIWKLVPPVRGDFNVPTVVPVDGRLLVSSENNGTRLYQFHADGTLDPMPLAVNVDLAPDAHTPMICGDHVYGIWNNFYVLDLRTGLKTSGAVEDDAFCDYCSLIASDSKLLALTSRSELILLSADMVSPKIASPKIISRLQLGDGNQKTLPHPAIVGSAIFVRFGRTLARLDLQ
jgi:outer membrane protein assembly factor BamB